MATPIEKPFLGQEGTERLVAVIKDLLNDKLDKNEAPKSQFVITLTYDSENDTYIPDKTFDELEVAYEEKRQIRAVTTDGLEFSLIAFMKDYMAYFTHCLTGPIYRIAFRADNVITMDSWEPYSESNLPTAIVIGAKGSNNVLYNSGDIRSWASAQQTSTSVGVSNKVANMPETGFNWIVDFTMSTNGLWRRMTATKLVQNGTPVTYESVYYANTWSNWVALASTGTSVQEVATTAYVDEKLGTIETLLAAL